MDDGDNVFCREFFLLNLRNTICNDFLELKKW